MAPSVPDRWLSYKPYGTVIEGTKILAFKVPLKKTVNANVPSEKQLTTSILMNAFPKLKFVIDLTNTTRYYSKEEFISAGVGYQKILVEGKKVPSLVCSQQFFKTMDNFHETSEDDEIIGVHCTHGLNRTGYLICRYLIQQFGWNLENAIEKFEKARGHPIERQEYIKALGYVPKNQKMDTSNIELINNSLANNKSGKNNRRNRKKVECPDESSIPSSLSSRNDNHRNGNQQWNRNYGRSREPRQNGPHPSQIPMQKFVLPQQKNYHPRFNVINDEIPFVTVPPEPPMFSEPQYPSVRVPYAPREFLPVPTPLNTHVRVPYAPQEFSPMPTPLNTHVRVPYAPREFLPITRSQNTRDIRPNFYNNPRQNEPRYNDNNSRYKRDYRRGPPTNLFVPFQRPNSDADRVDDNFQNFQSRGRFRKTKYQKS